MCPIHVLTDVVCIQQRSKDDLHFLQVNFQYLNIKIIFIGLVKWLWSQIWIAMGNVIDQDVRINFISIGVKIREKKLHVNIRNHLVIDSNALLDRRIRSILQQNVNIAQSCKIQHRKLKCDIFQWKNCNIFVTM